MFVTRKKITFIKENVDHNKLNLEDDINQLQSKGMYILSVYSPFSDRVGLPLHNIYIPYPFTSIMDIFFVDLKFSHIFYFFCFYTL